MLCHRIEDKSDGTEVVPRKRKGAILGGQLEDLRVSRQRDEIPTLCTMPPKSCTLHRQAPRAKQNPVCNYLNPSVFRC